MDVQLFVCRACGGDSVQLPGPEVEVDLQQQVVLVTSNGRVEMILPANFLAVAYGAWSAMIPVTCARCGEAGEICRDRLLGAE
jgi:hypothetical protein